MREVTWYLGAAAGIVAVTLAFNRVVPDVNNTTVGFSYLLVVLIAASAGGLGPAILASVGGVICFNYFFLPPKGSFTIADPQNWVALTAFLITAIVASQLSSAARSRTTDAERRREEVWKLYQLARAVIIIPDAESAISSIAWQVLDVFGASFCAVLVPAFPESQSSPDVHSSEVQGSEVHSSKVQSSSFSLPPSEVPSSTPSSRKDSRSGLQPVTCNLQPATPPNLQPAWAQLAIATTGGPGVELSTDVLSRVFNSGEIERVPSSRAGLARPELTYAPLNVGVRRVGVLVLVTPPLESGTIEAVAGLVAVALERARFLREASRTEALRQSDELKSALLASVSHALRTPLTSIRAAIDNLLQHDLSWDGGAVADQNLREFHLIISEEVGRLTRLVTNLLEMARIESGELHLIKEWTLVSEVFSNVLERCSPVLQNHTTAVQVDDEIPLVKIDSRLVAEAMVNIVENAAKYSPPGTEIKLEARINAAGSEAKGDLLRAANTPGSTGPVSAGGPVSTGGPVRTGGQARPGGPVRAGELVVTVADSGPGIEAGEIDRIFDKFYRSSSLTDSGTVGTGMGLAIARGIIVAHGGRVWADSPARHGTVFTLAIPVEWKPAESTESDSTESPETGSAPSPESESSSNDSPKSGSSESESDSPRSPESGSSESESESEPVLATPPARIHKGGEA
jgi:two-component system sensor histidine kinase KdpD